MLPARRPGKAGELEEHLASLVEQEGQRLVCWRDVPVDPAYVGVTAGAAAPVIRQLVVAAGDAMTGDQDAFERKLYVIRRRFELECGAEAVVPSFSSRTIVYKGMLTAPQLRGYFPDLRDERTESALALVHSRFSTNTFPSWELAHPYRMIAHNGEINTVRGNINWMRARESQLASELFGDDLEKVLPVVQSGGSDSATLDNVLELLVLGGRSLPARDHDDDSRGDGRARRPAARAARVLRLPPVPDGSVGRPGRGLVHGRPRDRRDARRNGLRPGRWLETRDGWVVLASESGCARDPGRRTSSARGACSRASSSSSTSSRADRPDDEVKRAISHAAAVRGVVRARGRRARRSARAAAADRADRVATAAPDRLRVHAGGHEGDSSRRSRGTPRRRSARWANDTPLAVLSDRHRLLFSLFKQLFAQVTNPPIDSIREAIVMSLSASIGSEKTLFDETPGTPANSSSRRRSFSTPSWRAAAPVALRDLQGSDARHHVAGLGGRPGSDTALERLCHEADSALAAGSTSLILSDRAVGADRAPMPSLLAVSAVHHHLVREGTRLQAGLVVESGETRSVHRVATLIGYGAAAVNPYLMLETVGELVELGCCRTG